MNIKKKREIVIKLLKQQKIFQEQQKKIFQEQQKNKWIVLLTTAVNVNNQENDIENRKIIYSNQIKNWLTKTNMHIFVVESTGCGFPKLNHDRLTIITTNLPKMNSSSQSEAASISYALNKIKDNEHFKNCSHILKVTGRYFLNNIENTLKNITPNLDVYLQIHKIKNWQNTEYYGIKKDLINPFIETVLENGLMEHKFDDFILSNNLTSQKIGPFKNNIPRGGDNLLINLL
jgi:hypothetical protein